MKILVSMRIIENLTYPELRDAISHDWASFFSKHNLLPILVPNALNHLSRYFDLPPQGLLLTGGESQGPLHRPTLRDHTEMTLIAEAIARDIPILGVCRGLQIINRYFGGGTVALPTKSHLGTHTIKLNDGTNHIVNSFHNEGVTLASLAAGLIPFACANEDGLVEAVRHETLPILAIQWHPERPNPASVLDRQIIDEWKNRCALSS
jgi:putative glutamine amidotransferase